MLKPNEKCWGCKQITNYFRKNVGTDKKYIMRKKSLEFQKSKSHISCKIEFYTSFIINCNSLELRGQWGKIISGSKFLKN